MANRLLLTCLAGLALSCTSAHSYPITFFDVQLDVTAIAITSGTPGFDSESSPPETPPASASADSVSTLDFASAGAIATPALLSTTADASGGGGITNAVATAHFSGSFLNAGATILSIDFSPLEFRTGSGSASTSLFVALTSGGITLFQDFITESQQFNIDLAAGTSSLLDLTLSSEASAGFPASGPGNASSFALVGVAGSVPISVPIPATWILLAIGMMAMAIARRERSRRTS